VAESARVENVSDRLARGRVVDRWITVAYFLTVKKSRVSADCAGSDHSRKSRGMRTSHWRDNLRDDRCSEAATFTDQTRRVFANEKNRIGASSVPAAVAHLSSGLQGSSPRDGLPSSVFRPHRCEHRSSFRPAKFPAIERRELRQTPLVRDASLVGGGNVLIICACRRGRSFSKGYFSGIAPLL